jgi:hypothetical protein
MEYPNDRLHRKARFAEELSGAGDPGEIDDPLQVRGTARTELPGEMFSADPQPLGEHRRANRAFHLAYQHAPGGLLQWLGKPEHSWGIDQGAPTLGCDRRPEHEVPGNGVVDTLYQDRRDRVNPAGQ